MPSEGRAAFSPVETHRRRYTVDRSTVVRTVDGRDPTGGKRCNSAVQEETPWTWQNRY